MAQGIGLVRVRLVALAYRLEMPACLQIDPYPAMLPSFCHTCQENALRTTIPSPAADS